MSTHYGLEILVSFNISLMIRLLFFFRIKEFFRTVKFQNFFRWSLYLVYEPPNNFQM